MNKYLTFAGQQPVYLGDIDFMQTAVGQAFANLLQHITGRSDANGILSGCEISFALNTVSWTDGVVALGGEILPISAGLLIFTPGDDLYFDIVSTTSGGRTFGDGNSHDCFETRVATITNVATSFPLSDVPRIKSRTVPEADVFSFDGVTNLYDRYAKLVYAGGAFHLMLRIKAPNASVTNLFSGTVSNLPQELLDKFSANNAPYSVGAIVKPVLPVQASAVEFASISWTVNGSDLEVSVDLGSAVTMNQDFEISQILPIF